MSKKKEVKEVKSTLKVDINEFREGYQSLVKRVDMLTANTAALQGKIDEISKEENRLMEELEEVAANGGDVKEVYYKLSCNHMLGNSCSEYFKTMLVKLVESLNNLKGFGLIGEEYVKNVEAIEYYLDEDVYLYKVEDGKVDFREPGSDERILGYIKANYTDEVVMSEVSRLLKVREELKKKETDGKEGSQETSK